MFDRELLMADFKPIKGSKIGELAANFEIILGRTPDERELQIEPRLTQPLTARCEAISTTTQTTEASH